MAELPWLACGLLATTLLGGCGPGGAAAPDLATVADLASAADLAMGPACGMAGPSVCGRVLDENTAPIGGVSVLACTMKSCEYGKSDASGGFVVVVPDGPWDMVVKTQEDTTFMPARAESVAPVHLPGGIGVDVGTLYVSRLPAPTLLGPKASDPQTVAAGDGLTLTLRRADLQPPLGDTDQSMAARQVPLAHVPPLPGVDAKRLVAVYALSPFSMSSTSPIAVRAPAALPAGAAVQFRTVSELDGTMSAPVAGTSDGTFVTTAMGVGITDLTWIVISQ